MSFAEVPLPLLTLWLLWLLQAAWCAFNGWAFLRRITRFEARYRRRLLTQGPYTPRAVVLVPVKGADARLEPHIAALQAQDYPDYRLQYLVESPEDPACEVLRAHGCDPLVAGRCEHGGQKVHNLMAGLRALRASDQVVVFSDADGVPSDQWLRRLVDPLRRTSVGATTGYRWLLPGAGLASAFLAVINASVATLTGPGWRSFAWGGATALRRELIDEARLADFWAGALSDDFRLSQAIRRTARSMLFLPAGMVASPVAITWRRLWEFGRRQHLITRLHVPWIWWVGLSATGLYTAAFASAIVAQFSGGAIAKTGLSVYACVCVLDAWRGSFRYRAERRLFPVAGDWRTWLLERVFTPSWMGLHFLIILSSAVGHCITWAGVTYDLRDPEAVRIVRR